MSVRFAVHEIARESLLNWQQRWTHGRRGGRELFGVYFNSLRDELIRTKGKSTGVRYLSGYRTTVGIWEFQFRDTWVVFIVEKIGGFWDRLFNRSNTRITLVAL